MWLQLFEDLVRLFDAIKGLLQLIIEGFLKLILSLLGNLRLSFLKVSHSFKIIKCILLGVSILG
jgi:hypothetical protein